MSRIKKNLNKRNNAKEILGQYTVYYSIQSKSRYKHIDELDLADGKTIKASMGPIDLSILPFIGGVTQYTVTPSDEGRLDIIAYNVYGQADLWWIIAYMNNISDPYTQITIGKQLSIPDLESVKIFPNPLS